MKKICNPSVLHAFLNEHGLKAKKQSSQNFLIDGNIIDKIILSAEVCSSDVILEIGPGPGALTQKMLSSGATVFAVEKDRSLAKALERLQTEDRRLHVLEMDFLKLDLDTLFSSCLQRGQKIKVVANLPYHITTPILSSLLPKAALIDTITVMVQKEVAQRFTAEKGTKQYSSYTLYIQHFGQVKYCFTVEPTCFYPKPSVQSAVVKFTLAKREPIDDEESFFRMIRTAFLQRRKMLKSSLKSEFGSHTIEASLKTLGLNPLARPEELSRQEFLHLYKLLRLRSSSSWSQPDCDDQKTAP